MGFTVMQHHYGESSFFGKSSHIFSRDGQFSSIFHSYVSYICEIAGGSIFVDTPAKMSRTTFGHTGRNQHLMPGNFIFVHETRRRGEGFSIAVRQSLFC